MIPEKGINNKRYTIGLLFGDFYGAYIPNLFANIIKNCREFGQNLMSFGGGFLSSAGMTGKDDNSNFIFDLIDVNKLDGMIVIGSIGNFISKKEMNQFLYKFSKIPMVNIGTNIEGMHNVLIDNQSGMYDLMTHLIEYHNYKKIAFIAGTEGNYDASQRLEVYKKSLENHNIKINEDLIANGNFSYAGGIKAFETLVERKADYEAIVCSNDYMALSVSREMHKRGLKIPGNAAITGFDDTEECWTAKPVLTTVKQPFYTIARETIKMLISLIKDYDTPEKIIIPTEFVIRESCGCEVLNKVHYINPENLKKTELSMDTDINNDKTGFFNHLMQKLNQELPILTNKLDMTDPITSLIDAFLKVKDGAPNDILYKKFKDIFTQLVYSDEEVITIYKLVTIFYREILTQFPGNDDHLQIKDLWNETITLLGLLVKEDQSEKRAKQKLESNIMFDINDTYINTFDMLKLREMIIGHLPQFQFKNFYVNLFEDENKELARSFVAYNKGQVLELSDQSFPVKQLFPKKNNSTEPFEYAVMGLRFKDQPYGFIIYDIQTLTCFIYESISVQISNAIKGALMTDEINKNTIQLETKVIERTRDLKNANEKLKQLDTLKNEFIANITHDFRSPLTVILNSADLAVRFHNIDAKTKEMFEIIYKSSIRLKSTIDRLLELAKMDVTGVILKIEKVNLVSYLNTLVDYYKSSVISSGIKITKKIPDCNINNFYTDVEKLDEILDNILSNAIKFVNPKTGIIQIELKETENDISISIADNGVGIPLDKLKDIFNRFEQTHAGRNSKYRGTGIGLAFSKQLAEYLKIKIIAESEGEGKGSKFILQLKKGLEHFDKNDISSINENSTWRRKDIKTLIEVELDEKLHNESLQTIFSDLNKENEYNYKKGVILIIEDDKNIREIIIKYLHHNGFQNFIVAADGKQGLDAVYEFSPDIIISDYNMPNMKGDDLHNRLVGNPKHREIPFIFLSAVTDAGFMLERRKIGAADFLKKPIDEKVLVLTVEEQLKKYFEYKKIMLMATIDELTSLHNRRSIIDNLNRELATRNFRDISILFFDIDHFKYINDNYGHQAGDLILSTIGNTIKKYIRKYDIAGRYGGDEFLIILPETGLDNAICAAKGLKDAIHNNKIFYQNKKLSVSSSFGIASLKDHQNHIAEQLGINNLEEIYKIQSRDKHDWEKIEKLKEKISKILIKMADDALYRAKKTICNDCGFKSEKDTIFTNDKCPKCGSTNLDAGRNKIIAF